MRRRKEAGRASNFFINIGLVLVVCVLYFVTSNHDALSVLPVMAPVYRGSARDSVALQLVVDWNASAISGIMDTLEEADVNITFAVSGEWARENPALLVRMAAEGHEIAVIGDRPALDGKLSEVVEDVEKAVQSVKEICGYNVRLYYSGERAQAVSAKAAEKLGLRQVLCTADLLCAKGSAEDIVLRALDAPIQGSILLLQPTKAAQQALPVLLEQFEQKGLRVTGTSGVLTG